MLAEIPADCCPCSYYKTKKLQYFEVESTHGKQSYHQYLYSHQEQDLVDTDAYTDDAQHETGDSEYVCYDQIGDIADNGTCYYTQIYKYNKPDIDRNTSSSKRPGFAVKGNYYDEHGDEGYHEDHAPLEGISHKLAVALDVVGQLFWYSLYIDKYSIEVVEKSN